MSFHQEVSSYLNFLCRRPRSAAAAGQAWSSRRGVAASGKRTEAIENQGVTDLATFDGFPTGGHAQFTLPSLFTLKHAELELEREMLIEERNSSRQHAAAKGQSEDEVSRLLAMKMKPRYNWLSSQRRT